MASITLTPSEKEIQAFLEHYQSSLAPSKNPYIRYFLRLPQATVSIYTSGKVLLQGEGAEKYASFFGYQVVEETSGQNLPLIGTDEVGNGSYFGGLAVVAPLSHLTSMISYENSVWEILKTLTDQKIRQIAPILKEKIQHQALLLSPSKYNEVIGDRYNAVSVKVALHNQAIYLLLQKGIQPEKIVIDAFTSAKNYDKYLAQEANRFSNPISLEEKAEGKYLAVAVSSVIARDLFLENLENLGRELGYQLPSGAGTPSDKVASQILQAYGMQGLNFCAKLHFKNTEKAKKRLER